MPPARKNSTKKRKSQPKARKTKRSKKRSKKGSSPKRPRRSKKSSKPKRQKISPPKQKKQKKESDEAVIMVDMNPKGSWTYPAYLFPAHWRFDGGDTFIFGDKKPRYTRTEWFIGRPHNSKIMKQRLERYFERLKRDGKVSSYRIKISRNDE